MSRAALRWGAMNAYPSELTLTPSGPLDADVRPPGSKSITNRVLLMAALADGVSRIRGALVAEDSEVMIDALRRLGATVEVDPAQPGEVRVVGVAGRWPVAQAELDLVLSGTSMRFLSAAVALGRGHYTLTGNARMRERPIGDLIDALATLGVRAEAEPGGTPPVVLHADGLPGGRTEVAGDRSSQFLSGLLLAAPWAQGPLRIEVTGTLQSRPFIDMTLALMERFGASVKRDGYRSFEVAPSGYRAVDLSVEGDAMAAGYAWGAAAISGGEVRVAGLPRASLQGDARFAATLAAMGCEVTWRGDTQLLRAPAGRLRGGTFDLNDLPDQAQTLAVLALAADAPVEIVNVANLRIKETDRLAALSAELRKFGAEVEERSDALRVTPIERPPGRVRVDTYGDHRMAMAFALAGARWPGVTIRDPGCVAKTYPDFFRDLAAWGVGVSA